MALCFARPENLAEGLVACPARLGGYRRFLFRIFMILSFSLSWWLLGPNSHVLEFGQRPIQGTQHADSSWGHLSLRGHLIIPMWDRSCQDTWGLFPTLPLSDLSAGDLGKPPSSPTQGCLCVLRVVLLDWVNAVPKEGDSVLNWSSREDAGPQRGDLRWTGQRGLALFGPCHLARLVMSAREQATT